MNYRSLGSTDLSVSEVSFGAWAIGGSWGDVDDDESLAALHHAIDLGVNFIDTADVYGGGRSERLIAQALAERSEEVYVATKAGRRLSPHKAAGYTKENLTAFVEESLQNLQVEALDLVQLHCPPTAVYYQPETFAALDDLKRTGKIRHYGVSVEKVEQALKAIEYPGVETVQIIFNIFRQRPLELFFEQAQKRNIGVIVRVPLASGLLTGKMSRETKFADDDHRQFNRHSESFDQGETFAGVDYETGLGAVEALKPLVPEGATMAQLALRWILMHGAVSCTIPGAKRPAQVEENVAAAELQPLSEAQMQRVHEIYEDKIYEQVHYRW